MNARERFLATAGSQPVDRTFILPPWAWEETVTRWEVERLPHGADLVDYFQTDRVRWAPIHMNGRYGPHLVPPLERLVVEETDKYQIVRDEEGNTVKLFRQNATSSMPMWLEYPVRNRRDWEEIVKPRLDPTAPGRFPVSMK